MGASFLEIDSKKEGGSGDGYAKVISEEEFNRRAMELYTNKLKKSILLLLEAIRVNQRLVNHQKKWWIQ